MLVAVSDGREKTAILVAASLIAAVRLAREEIKQSPKVMATISDSIRLAEMIWARIEKR
jgi:hypothetical protein